MNGWITIQDWHIRGKDVEEVQLVYASSKRPESPRRYSVSLQKPFTGEKRTAPRQVMYFSRKELIAHIKALQRLLGHGDEDGEEES